tara:strand:+ start:446 stop:1315 length:870 start_codon:yes stop_codon:yes gene_type:complete
MRLLYPLAKRFIAGHSFDSAKPKIDRLIEDGYEVSVDYLGELSQSAEDCEKAKAQYVEIINYYEDQNIDISIKPSQLGLLINPAISLKHITLLAKLAKRKGHTIRLDMEDSKVTELTRNLAISLNKKFGNVGVAVQANLFRTKEDLRALINNRVSIRLVKGAYKENNKIALQDDLDIEASFFNHAAELASKGKVTSAIATHDESLLEDIEDMIPNPYRFDYEFLYGIRRDLQRDFKKKDCTVRIYVPFGKDWLPYTLRRLREWKNLKFVIISVFREFFKKIVDRRLSGV